MALFAVVLAHIQIASPGLPVLQDIQGRGAHQAQAAGLVWEQRRDPCAALDLAIDDFDGIARAQPFAVVARQLQLRQPFRERCLRPLLASVPWFLRPG